MELFSNGNKFSVARKAGMQDVDLDETSEFIYQISKNSRFFKSEQKKEALLQERVNALVAKVDTLPLSNDELLAKIDQIEAAVESERDLTKSWLHIDMDAFYAAVEVMDNFELAGKPLAVGNLDMLATSSYEARKFGVRAGIPGFIALQLCPQLEIVPVRMDRYREVSSQISEVLSHYDPNYQMLSLDEAALNITDYCITSGKDAVAVANCIKQDIFSVTSLTCSVGIATTNTLAKICAEVRKPNGVFMLTPERDCILNFMLVLPVRKVPGVGKVMDRMLKGLGITKCGQLKEAREVLFQLFPAATCRWFVQIWLGVVSSKLKKSHVKKSVSREKTLRDFFSMEDLRQLCIELCGSVAVELEKMHCAAKLLSVRIKSIDFEIENLSVNTETPLSKKEEIVAVAVPLLEKLLSTQENPQNPLIRMVGVRVSDFICSDPAAVYEGESQTDTSGSSFSSSTSLSPSPSPTPPETPLTPNTISPPRRGRGRPKSKS